MANKKTAPKKTATKKVAKKVTKKVTAPTKSVLYQEVSAKNTFLIVLLAAFVVMAVVLIGL
jgi:hypothetical protein